MDFETLLVTAQDAVATVLLNRPAVRNALNSTMLRELDEAFTALGDDPSVRVIILRGAGEKAFAAGADISELAAVDASNAAEFAERAQRIFRRIETLPKPVIAAINGFALGGGCELAMACTLRIAVSSAHLGQPEVLLGILPGYGGSQRLPRLVGRGAALRMMLTGARIDAAEALRIGLVDEVVPADPGADHLEIRTAELARTLASHSPLAVAAILEAVDRGADLPLQEAIALEASIFARLCATEDMREGTRAFLEKRAPRFTGR
ncbi:MAG TPA: enoyl-CoA hydratase-related protein [Acidobacteriaceae bacterium]|nr:enoyl-CoA hydratase-related protein [Acidobacteriaceae bacterium]